MNIEEIKTFLPHREPMLLVDSLEEEVVTNALGDEIKTKRPLYTGIDNVRFKYQVRPGDTIVLRSTITERRQTLIFAKAEAKVDGKLCCRGNLSFALI